jgi:undecaprenyl-diphosphatase
MSVRGGPGLVLPAALAALWIAMFLLGGSGSSVDLSLLASFYAGDNPMLANLARFVTPFGGWEVLTGLGAAFALYLVWRREFARALLFAAIAISGRLAIHYHKIFSGRARPDEEHLVAVHSLSFPSGHSGNAAITYFAMALLLTPLVRSEAARRGIFIAAAVVTVAVGLSRMILGVHWPSDVLGGWAFGLLWTFGLIRLAEHMGTPSRLRH